LVNTPLSCAKLGLAKAKAAIIAKTENADFEVILLPLLACASAEN
jgi:hypothetical protein